VKANEFVKKHGWDSLLIAKTLPKFNRYKYVIFYADEIDFSNEFHAGRKSYMFDVAEVKRLVESYKVVEQFGGLEKAMDAVINQEANGRPMNQLAQAIADVESCMEVS